MEQTNKKQLSIHDAFEFAWSVYREHIALFTACILTFFASWVVLEIIVIAGQRFGLFLWVIAHSSFLIVFAGMEVGFLKICLSLHDGKQVRYTDLFRELRVGVGFLIVQASYLLMILVGLALFVVPGGYLGTRYTLFAFTFAEGNPNPRQSFQESAVLSQDSMWFLFRSAVLIILLNILGASLLGMGLLITIPLSTLMKVYVYRQLKN
jgi:uncharacterized membrane protein